MHLLILKKLPIGLKERLKSSLSIEDMLKLEGYNENDQEYEYQTQKSSNSFFKIPIFQPTAAAAMMYNVSMHKQQQQQKNQQKSDELGELMKKTLSNSSLNKMANLVSVEDVNEIQNVSRPVIEITNGKIPGALIAQVLRKEDEDPSKKSQKLFPHICLRCRKETSTCNIGVQTVAKDLSNENLKIIYARSNFNESLLRSKTVGTGLSNLKDDKELNETMRSNSGGVYSKHDQNNLWNDVDINTVAY